MYVGKDIEILQESVDMSSLDVVGRGNLTCNTGAERKRLLEY